jgi:DNA-binding PadR family transcriptional regulator
LEVFQMLLSAKNDPPRPTPVEMTVLRLLVRSSKPRYGLDLVESSEGELKVGSVYVTLHRMERKGYIRSYKEPAPADGAAARRLYELTALGRRVFEAWDAGFAAARERYAEGAA